MIAGPNAKIQRSESKQLRRVVLREDPSAELQNCIASVRCYISSVLRPRLQYFLPSLLTVSSLCHFHSRR
jgi:hypothetical protein